MKIKNREINVAVLIRNFSSSAGGAERYCVELTKILAKNFKVVVFTQNFDRTYENIKIKQVPKIKKPRFLNQIFFSFLTRIYTKNKFDIVHSHDMVTHANVNTIHVPCVKTNYSGLTKTNIFLKALKVFFSPRILSYLWLEKKQMDANRTNQIIAVSSSLRKNILLNYPNISRKISVSEPGINFRDIQNNPPNRDVLLKSLKLKKDSFLLLFSAHGFERKGLPTLIHAMKLLNNEKIKLIVAGRGKYITHKEKNIYYLGVVDDMDLLYDSVDVLVHPTLADTFGMSVLEALSHKLPVIVSSSEYCGITSSLSSNEVVKLYNPKNAIEIKDKIELLFNDEKLRKKLVGNGYRKSKLFTWSTTFQKTLAAYQKNL